MYEIHTITFDKDLRLLELQLLAVDQLFNHNSILKYKIIINDVNHEDIKKKIDLFIKNNITYTLAQKIELCPFTTYLTVEGDGWKDQQYLKLMSVADSLADWVLVLDSKNHFTKNTSIENFFINGKAKTVFKEPSNKTQLTWLYNSLKYFEISNYKEGEAMPTITPYLMKPILVKLLLNKIKSNSSSENFLKNKELQKASEFYLYYSFLKKIEAVHEFYVKSNKIGETLFTVWPQNPETVENILNKILKGEVHLLGLHRRRLAQLTETQKNLIKFIWSNLRLPEDENYYLSMP